MADPTVDSAYPAATEPQSPDQLAEDRKITQELRDRFAYASQWEAEARNLFKEDMKFANGDSNNNFQWPQDIIQMRQSPDARRPMITVNKTRQHNLIIINDAKKNKPGIKIVPSGGAATYEAAQALSGLCRQIEYRSNAQAAYDRASTCQVQGGVGYWRVVTDYVDDSSFDQEVLIKQIFDPLTVFIDPDAREMDKSDMNWAILFEDMTPEVFKTKYPQVSEADIQDPAYRTDMTWYSKQVVRVAEYFRRTTYDDVLVLMPQGGTIMQSQLDADSMALLQQTPNPKTRKVRRTKVEWFMVCGNRVVDRREWPGKYIPVVQIVGEETIIDGSLDRKGHTRAMKDPQRMYNYWSSNAVEYGALQTKVPWIAAAEAIEPYKKVWETSNKQNYAYLPFKHKDEDGTPLPPPTKIEPPAAAPVAMTGMEVAQKEMMLVSGQFDAQMGQQGNERSGRAIAERQRQGDTATYHFIDNLAMGVQYTGKILLDIIPHIYDTPRIIAILAEDGTRSDLKINPQSAQASGEEQGDEQEVPMQMLNPKIGIYQVQAHSGPGYATQREEAFEAYTTLLTQAPGLAAIIGDLLFKAADFPYADQAAERLKRLVPPVALGEGPTQQEQKLQQEVEQLKQLLGQAIDELTKSQAQLARNKDKTEVDEYKAFTERLKTLLDANLGAAEFKLSVGQLAADLMMDPTATDYNTAE
jgi:hypothetical protein